MYFYSIGRNYREFTSMREARNAMRYAIKRDSHTCTLNRDNRGYFILRYGDKPQPTKFYL